MGASGPSARSLTGLPTVLFVASLATLVQGFLYIKLFFLGLFLLASLVDVAVRKKIAIHPQLMWFYLSMAVAGCTWAVVGWYTPGNSRVGVTDALRLYVLWSVVFAVLFSLLRSRPSLWLFHVAMVSAGIVISVINFVGLYDYIAESGLISDAVRKQLELNVGIHEGYIQITSNNIGSLFLIVPYLLSLQLRADAGKANSVLAKLSLLLCLILAALSGRRALWLVVGLTPSLIFLLAILTKNVGALRRGSSRLLATCSVATLLAVALLVAGMSGAFSERLQEFGYVRHLQAAFSAEDERTIQRDYLLNGFSRSPLLGSGFGAYAGYTRSDDRPWTYELTYHQMLFNVGLVGVTFLGALLSLYMVLVIRLLRRFKEGSAIPFGLLLALCSLLVGAYSNPYLGSFALLFFIGLLPYLSTFRRGFERL